MEPDKKFFFDVNIFDAPEKEEVPEDLPPPPPTFSEDELSAAKDMAFEQGRQQGRREETQSREQQVSTLLEKIADDFAHLFAAEQLRENIYEKESLKLTLKALDLIFPSMNDRLGQGEVQSIIEKTLIDHRKKKEISIFVPAGMKGDIEMLISRIRANEHEEALWRVIEEDSLSPGDCRMEWSDGGAVRDSRKTARDIHRNIEALLGPVQEDISEIEDSDIVLEDNNESATPVERNDE